MTITIQVDEAVEFQRRCRGWSDERAQVSRELYESRMILIRQSDSTASNDIREIQNQIIVAITSKMITWEKEHPFPRLLPSV